MPSTKPAADFEYTDQQLLDLWREALAVISVRGKDYMIGSRRLTAFDLPQVREMIEYYERRVAAASTGLSVNLARMK